MKLLQDKRFLLFLLIIGAPLLFSLLVTKTDLLKPILPEKEVKIQLTKAPDKDPNLQKGPFKCPSEATFCAQGKDIFKGSEYMGFGVPLPSGSPIFASFDGTISSIISETQPGATPSGQINQGVVTLFLDNSERGLRAIYYYQANSAPKDGEVKEGAIIDHVGPNIPFYEVPLIFSLIKNDPTVNEKTRLTRQDFK